MKYITLAIAVLLGGFTAHLLNEQPQASKVSPATAAILNTLSPESLPNLRLAEYLSGAADNFAESDMSKASPTLTKATRLKVNEPK